MTGRAASRRLNAAFIRRTASREQAEIRRVEQTLIAVASLPQEKVQAALQEAMLTRRMTWWQRELYSTFLAMPKLETSPQAAAKARGERWHDRVSALMLLIYLAVATQVMFVKKRVPPSPSLENALDSLHLPKRSISLRFISDK